MEKIFFPPIEIKEHNKAVNDGLTDGTYQKVQQAFLNMLTSELIVLDNVFYKLRKLDKEDTVGPHLNDFQKGILSNLMNRIFN